MKVKHELTNGTEAVETIAQTEGGITIQAFTDLEVQVKPLKEDLHELMQKLPETFQQTAIDFREAGDEAHQVFFEKVEHTDPKRTLYLKFDRPIQVCPNQSDQGIYLSAALSRVPWPTFEELGRAVWTILLQVLKADASNIAFDQGLLMVGDCFYPAARFKIADESNHPIGLDQPIVQERLSICVRLLGDEDIWRHDLDQIADQETCNAILAARLAREQIKGKAIPCASSIENKSWDKSIGIPQQISEKRPPGTRQEEVVQIGHPTGFCRVRRVLHFQTYGARAPFDLSFDAEVFFERIMDVIKIENVMLRATWIEGLEDLTVKTRTLVDFEQIEGALC